jgi:hypothetical protein
MDESSMHRYGWEPNIILYSGPGGPGRNRLAVLDDGSICCLYEADNCATITFAKFPLTWLTAEAVKK